MISRWAEKSNFVTEDILDEYKEVLKRLGVRPSLTGTVINPIRERAEQVHVHASFEISPDPKDDPLCLCAEEGQGRFRRHAKPQRLSARTASGKRHFT